MPRGSKCLRALRAHMIATPSAPPEIVDGEVVTASGKFACDAPTGYRSSRSGAGVYSLEAVVLLLRTAKSSDYLKACLAKKLQNVVLGDQSDLKAYVTGAAADSAQLEDDDADDDDVAMPSADAPAKTDAPAADAAAAAGVGYDGIPIYDRNHGLLVPGKDYTFAVELYERFVKKERKERQEKHDEKVREKEQAEKDIAAGKDPKKRKRDEQRAKDKAAAAEAAKKKRRAEAAAKAEGEPKRESVGIIIVPAAMTSTVTLLNVADLLEKGKFATVAEKRAAGAKKEPMVRIERVAGDGTIQSYKIVDNPQRLSDADWKRVVAVFAAGAAWQFKGWKYAKPVDIFNRVLGVHLKYDDAETLPEVKKWNVTVLTVNKFKRHLDPTTVVQFWRLLDDFLEKRKKAIAGMKARKK